jgi:cytochrome P450
VTQRSRLSSVDTVRLVGKVLLPTVGIGAIKRRPWAMAVSARWELTGRAIRELERLRSRYGAGPLRASLFGHPLAVVLDTDHVSRVLAGAPEPFSPASAEKVAALRHFQPHGVLISSGAERAARRRLNEQALRSDQPVHPLHQAMESTIERETELMLSELGPAGTLDWGRFNQTWWRIVRQIVLGAAARDDHGLTDRLAALRRSANWAFAVPVRDTARDRLTREVAAYVERAEPESLAGYLASIPAPANTDPAGQIPHWLFAFDAAGMTAMRTLAVLASHPDHAARATTDADYRRACVLDTVRLWPTTPALLRQSTEPTTLSGQHFPAGTTFLIYTPFLHRDRARLSTADQFDPDGWLTGADRPGLVPFSAGPAHCPGQNLVLLTTSLLLHRLLATRDVTLTEPPALDPDRLPTALDNFAIRLNTHALRSRSRS